MKLNIVTDRLENVILLTEVVKLFGCCDMESLCCWHVPFSYCIMQTTHTTL